MNVPLSTEVLILPNAILHFSGNRKKNEPRRCQDSLLRVFINMSVKFMAIS